MKYGLTSKLAQNLVVVAPALAGRHRRASFRPFVCSYVHSFVRLSIHPSTFNMGILWAQLLLQFCTHCFEILHVFSSWYEDMDMWIGHNCWISFCHFFDIVTLVIFHPDYIDRGYLLLAQLLLVLYQLFSNFACVFLMVWGCACGLDIIVGSLFCHFFDIVILVIFHPDYIDSGYLLLDQFLSLFQHCELSHFSPWIYRQWVLVVSATPLTVLYQ